MTKKERFSRFLPVFKTFWNRIFTSNKKMFWICSYDDSKDITSSKNLNWKTSVGNENLDSSTYRELHLGLLFNKCKQSKLFYTNQGNITLQSDLQYIVCIRSYDDSKDITSSKILNWKTSVCLLYTSPSPRD